MNMLEQSKDAYEMRQRIASKIQLLSREIQDGQRTYYNSRCIEWLAGILRGEPPMNMIKWLDNVDKEQYVNLLGL